MKRTTLGLTLLAGLLIPLTAANADTRANAMHSPWTNTPINGYGANYGRPQPLPSAQHRHYDNYPRQTPNWGYGNRPYGNMPYSYGTPRRTQTSKLHQLQDLLFGRFMPPHRH